jgi:hypothetical protein
MMKFAALGLSLFLVSMPSQASQTPDQHVLVLPQPSIPRIQTATKNVLASAASRTRKILLIINAEIDESDDNPPGPDELDMHSTLGRSRVVHQRDVIDDDLTPYVRVRLAVARAKAMAKYREKMG